MRGKLFLVGTPIGNLSDISSRAIQTLQNVDIIACEDTRNSKTLLSKHGIFTKTISHHSHNEKNSTDGIIKLLEQGKNLAIISDSGMPVISDPGSYLVDKLREMNFDIDVIPGPTAFTTALTFAGITPPYLFHGFAPSTPKKLRRILRKYCEYEFPVVFYESPHKITNFLENSLKLLGDRYVILLRELTKIHQEYLNMRISELLEYKDENKFRGELVIVIMPKEKPSESEGSQENLLIPL